MVEGLAALSRMDYPGRFIILGRIPRGDNIAIYGLTARSQQNQARKLVWDSDRTAFLVQPLDRNDLQRTDSSLVFYPAIISNENGVAVSNGAQTYAIARNLNPRKLPEIILARALEGYDFEPDDLSTPRIAGCILGDHAALAIIKSENGHRIGQYFTVPLINGQGKLISTYSGSRDLLQPFSGEPRSVELHSDNLVSLTSEVYDSLAPKAMQNDLRVAVVVSTYSPSNEHKFHHIINRHKD